MVLKVHLLNHTQNLTYQQPADLNVTSEYESEDIAYDITVGLTLALMILATALGNCLVITAVIKDNQLNTTAHKLVASLAFTDLLVGILVMPLSAAHLIVGSWPFGWLLCDIFTTLDIVCCTSSILHLVAIALDRYWSITNVTYSRGSKKHKYFQPIAITGAWLLSAAICMPPLLGWRTEQPPNTCLISQDKGFTIYSTVGAFYLPLVVIIVIYFKIYLVVRERVRGIALRRQNRTHSMPIIEITTNPHLKTSETNETLESSLTESLSSDRCAGENQTVEADKPDIFNLHTDINRNHSVVKLLKSVPLLNRITGHSHSGTYKDKLAAKREKKALRTLLIITGVFITCWLPFFAFAVLLPFCDTCQVPASVTNFVTWLGYFNCMLNPIIYTIFSPDFRAAFKKLLCRVH